MRKVNVAPAATADDPNGSGGRPEEERRAMLR